MEPWEGGCPHCGEPLPPGAENCPACGADEEAGWNEEGDLYGDLPAGYGPDADFDYDDTVAREVEGRRPGVPWGLLAAVLLLVAALLALVLAR